TGDEGKAQMPLPGRTHGHDPSRGSLSTSTLNTEISRRFQQFVRLLPLAVRSPFDLSRFSKPTGLLSRPRAGQRRRVSIRDGRGRREAGGPVRVTSPRPAITLRAFLSARHDRTRAGSRAETSPRRAWRWLKGRPLTLTGRPSQAIFRCRRQ